MVISSQRIISGVTWTLTGPSRYAAILWNFICHSAFSAQGEGNCTLLKDFFFSLFYKVVCYLGMQACTGACNYNTMSWVRKNSDTKLSMSSPEFDHEIWHRGTGKAACKEVRAEWAFWCIGQIQSAQSIAAVPPWPFNIITCSLPLKLCFYLSFHEVCLSGGGQG